MNGPLGTVTFCRQKVDFLMQKISKYLDGLVEDCEILRDGYELQDQLGADQLQLNVLG